MILDPNKTALPIGIVASMLVFLAGGTWWMSALYARVASAEQDISTLQQSHRETVKELKEMNQTLVEIKTILKKQ